MPSSLSIPPHYLANTAGFLGGFITLNNIYGAWNPRGALTTLGFPTPSSPSDQTLLEGMTRMFATSRIVLGTTTLAMWYYGNHKALGVSMLVGCIMAINDGLVSKEVSGQGEWNHWGAAPIGIGIGLGLLLAVLALSNSLTYDKSGRMARVDLGDLRTGSGNEKVRESDEVPIKRDEIPTEEVKDE